ncbi:caspase family protein [Nonomuraea sp. NEAU-A123]|uniref:caspase family protein n=1 Tax=Nonomuraea sp. NEAU-A123 TaxID=2839649 RepID=UPI001BE47649|nr:caspase family protein [Nonomuraea sp. NEAU-A123]MBT2233660.1 caspase family protein [Nonomuraea sp. NEAU-A123]
MASETTRLRVQVIDAAADAQDLDQAAASLKDELLELDVMVSAEEGAQAPEGARGDLTFTLGGLVIGLAGTEVLATILNAVTAWLSRNQHRSVKLDVEGDVLEVTGIASKEQRELIDVWLHRRQPDAPARTGRRMALIVAGDEYRDPGLRRLRAPALDAEALAGVLGDAAIGGFDVRTMLNESTAVINEAVEEFFADRHPDDLLLLHFSGHGVKNDNGELYFATPTTKLNRLGATAVSAEFVNRLMSRSRCRRIVLLLDCCYAGAFGRGALPRAGSDLHVEEQFGGRGRVVITASNALEYAFDGPELADARDTSPSVFTSALVEGLKTGDADRDQDGYVGIHELYDYVYDKVRTGTPKQTPGKWTFDVQGDLVIARRSRPVSRPAPLPPELQEAVDHPIADIRAGTIDALARLRGSRHAGLALAARLTLERLADDDSRMVSAAAAQALSADTASLPAGPAVPPAVPPVRPVAAKGIGAQPRTTPAGEPAPTTESAINRRSSSRRDEDEIVPRDAFASRRRPWTPALRALAFLSVLLLLVGPRDRESGIGYLWLQGGAHPTLFLLLVGTAMVIGLLREGRPRTALLGAAAGLAALHVGLFAQIIAVNRLHAPFEAMMTLTGTVLILLVVLLEMALALEGPARAVAAVAGLLAVTAMIIDLVVPISVAEVDGPTTVSMTTLALLGALIFRVGLDSGRQRAWRPIVLGMTATVLVTCGVISLQIGDDPRSSWVPAYLPVLLVLFVVESQVTHDRLELLAGLHFVVIAGLIHNFALVPTGAGFLVVLLIAAAFAGAAAYLTRARDRARVTTRVQDDFLSEPRYLGEA